MKEWFAEKPSLSSEWKTERVREDASGDSEDGEEDDDKLPCVINESDGDCIWRGFRRSVGSSFHRQGAPYRKEQLEISQRSVDQEWPRIKNVCCDKVEQKLKLWIYCGWFVVRTLYIRERSLYLMHSFILSQCRDWRTGVMWKGFGVLVTAQAREFCMF